MPVRIGQLDIVAAARPPQRGEEGAEPPRPPMGLDVIRIIDDEQRRRLRRRAD